MVAIEKLRGHLIGELFSQVSVGGLKPVPAKIYYLQRVPALRAFWDLEKTVLYEIRVSGTVVNPLLTRKSPICTYIS